MKYLLIITTIFLASCIPSEKSKNNSNLCANNICEFYGSWETKECKQVGSFEGVWVRSNYNFKKDETIVFKTNLYNDSTCSGVSDETSEPAISQYRLVGEIVIEEGIVATEIAIASSLTDESMEINGGLVATESNELCSSKSFHFGAVSFSISNDTDLSGNYFNNCLLRRP